MIIKKLILICYTKMSKVLGLLVAATVIIIKLYYEYNQSNDEKGVPLSSNYWMVHDIKYNPYNT